MQFGVVILAKGLHDVKKEHQKRKNTSSAILEWKGK